MLTMITSGGQTDSIQSGLEETIELRPNAHDLIKDIFETLGIRVLMVKVDSFHDGTYYSRIFVEQQGRILDLDTRPSDAIAIAVRTGAPIYVREEIMDGYGDKTC